MKPAWRKSRRSHAMHQCVQVASIPGGILVGDSKNPGQRPLSLSPAMWSQFIRQIKAER